MSGEFYIICKFTSGEQVMAVLDAEDDNFVVLMNPVLIKTIPAPDSYKEHLAAQPLCQFSDDNKFIIHKQHVLFIKKLHHVFVSHYKRITSEYDRTTFIEDGKEDKEETLSWDTTPQEDKEEHLLRNFVEGNDTIN